MIDAYQTHTNCASDRKIKRQPRTADNMHRDKSKSIHKNIKRLLGIKSVIISINKQDNGQQRRKDIL